ncbi:hypothetical protein EON68_04125, partial [archaeon]
MTARVLGAVCGVCVCVCVWCLCLCVCAVATSCFKCGIALPLPTPVRSTHPLQLNSETDFVARNALFQALAGQVAKVALSLPGPASESASITTPSGAAPFSDEEMDALKAMPMG